ncbi:MAG: apolipoprotein N-acyltransferase, partial [Victivallales bacterium]|nr:apolipoprotein N-acyltransferase [Victivallales bacterium]
MLKIRHKFAEKAQDTAKDEPNEFYHAAFRFRLLDLFACFAGGCCFAGALPPLNWNFLALLTLAPVVAIACRSRWKFAALCGYAWGFGWSLFAFRFLREIDPVIPLLMPWVISLWPALWVAFLPFLWRNTIFPLAVELEGFEARKNSLGNLKVFWRLLIFAAGAAALYTLVEWTRSRLFPWNDLSITMWRDIWLIQFASITGHLGIMFAVAFCGCAFGVVIAVRFRPPGIKLLLLTAALYALLHVTGILLYINHAPTGQANWFPALLQGDISQRRDANIGEAQEALDIYASLSREAMNREPKPDIVIWPESAVPIPFRASHPVSAEFRRTVQALTQSYHVPLLIGAIDFQAPSILDKGYPKLTNSALFFDKFGLLRCKYDKIHRVPFGEYVPFRRYLPEFVIKRIDMNRDLAPGTNYDPVPLGEDVRAGVAICYEGIFSYLTRKFALRGANVLLVLSNDAWYPVSSEPEQH